MAKRPALESTSVRIAALALVVFVLHCGTCGVAFSDDLPAEPPPNQRTFDPYRPTDKPTRPAASRESTEKGERASDPFGGDSAAQRRLASATSRPLLPEFQGFEPVTYSKSERKILLELRNESSFDYLDQPLRDVIDDISFRHNIPIVVDRRALAADGVDDDLAVTLSLKGVSLDASLKLMLRALDGLTYIVCDDVLYVTTHTAAETRTMVHVYAIAGEEDLDELVAVLENVFQDDDVIFSQYGKRIVAKGPFRKHQQVMDLLSAICE